MSDNAVALLQIQARAESLRMTNGLYVLLSDKGQPVGPLIEKELLK